MPLSAKERAERRKQKILARGKSRLKYITEGTSITSQDSKVTKEVASTEEEKPAVQTEATQPAEKQEAKQDAEPGNCPAKTSDQPDADAQAKSEKRDDIANKQGETPGQTDAQAKSGQQDEKASEQSCSEQPPPSSDKPIADHTPKSTPSPAAQPIANACCPLVQAPPASLSPSATPPSVTARLSNQSRSSNQKNKKNLLVLQLAVTCLLALLCGAGPFQIVEGFETSAFTLLLVFELMLLGAVHLQLVHSPAIQTQLQQPILMVQALFSYFSLFCAVRADRKSVV